jgi:hypothetical protein
MQYEADQYCVFGWALTATQAQLLVERNQLEDA